MARNDGVDRTIVRNHDLKAPGDVAKIQEHNEREKANYSNQDIVPERTAMNVHFKAPTASYAEMFGQLEREKVISTRGLKPDAVKFGELVFDVNSAYFYNRGGYEFAKQFYADAYRAAVEIVGGEQFILSAVMHADERNRAMSEALGEDVYHYHLHVVYIPVVEKQVLWSKRCKDKSLVGTVKETLMQVSRSKKWASKPALDAEENPMLNAKGKQILKSSYSVLQDDFFHFMRSAGYLDVERGERGSTEEHLTVTQFKVKAEQRRLEAVSEQVAHVQRDGEDEHDDREEAHDEHLHGVVALNTQPEVLLLGAESEDADYVLHTPGHEVDDEARKAQKVQETLYYLTIAKLTEAHDDEGEFRLPRDRAQPGSLSHCCSPPLSVGPGGL